MEKGYDWFILCEKPDQVRKIEQALGIINQRSPNLAGRIGIAGARGRLFNFAKPEAQNKKRYSRDAAAKKSTNGFSVSNDKSYRSDASRLEDMPVLLNTRKDGQIIYEYSDNEAKKRGEILKEGLLSAKKIIIATDWDVGGELVFNDLVVYYGLDNQLDWQQVYRVRLQGLDSRSIQEAFDDKMAYGDAFGSALPEIQTMVAQGYARSILDYEFGYTFSYYAKVILRQLNLQHAGGLGRLKLSILNALLDREKEMEEQDLRPVYHIQMKMGELVVELDETFHSKQSAEGKIGYLPAIVSIELNNAVREVPAPMLFDRTSFIVLMDSFDPINWGRALQEAYETLSAVSYPRTSSNKLHQRQYRQLQELLKNKDIQELVDHRLAARGHASLAFSKQKMRPAYLAKKDEVLSHHALIPTKVLSMEDKADLQKSGKKRAWQVYEEILMRSLAIFAENGIDRGQMVRLYDEDGTLLKKFILQNTEKLGWRKLIDGPVYRDKLLDYDGEVTPEYLLEKKIPEQIQPYNHAALLSYLNQNNIGTDASREPVITELLNLKMISKDREGEYSVNKVVAQVLRVIRTKGWLRQEDLGHWDAGLEDVRSMSDAVALIENRREKLKEINQKVKTWYTTI